MAESWVLRVARSRRVQVWGLLPLLVFSLLLNAWQVASEAAGFALNAAVAVGVGCVLVVWVSTLALGGLRRGRR